MTLAGRAHPRPWPPPPSRGRLSAAAKCVCCCLVLVQREQRDPPPLRRARAGWGPKVRRRERQEPDRRPCNGLRSGGFVLHYQSPPQNLEGFFHLPDVRATVRVQQLPHRAFARAFQVLLASPGHPLPRVFDAISVRFAKLPPGQRFQSQLTAWSKGWRLPPCSGTWQSSAG